MPLINKEQLFEILDDTKKVLLIEPLYRWKVYKRRTWYGRRYYELGLLFYDSNGIVVGCGGGFMCDWITYSEFYAYDLCRYLNKYS